MTLLEESTIQAKGKTWAVSAIRNGTVIDHISPGQALKIIRLLKLAKHQKQIYVGLNLPSNKTQLKDIIKVEDWELTLEEASQVAILSPQATINIITEFEVSKKYHADLPDTIAAGSVISCPNPRCISNYEKTENFFTVIQRSGKSKLRCRYCKKAFSLDDIETRQ